MEKFKWILLLSGIDISGKALVKKTFTHVQEQKKRFHRNIPLKFRLV